MSASAGHEQDPFARSWQTFPSLKSPSSLELVDKKYDAAILDCMECWAPHLQEHVAFYRHSLLANYPWRDLCVMETAVLKAMLGVDLLERGPPEVTISVPFSIISSGC